MNSSKFIAAASPLYKFSREWLKKTVLGRKVEYFRCQDVFIVK
jgi:hypothetical protein